MKPGVEYFGKNTINVSKSLQNHCLETKLGAGVPKKKERKLLKREKGKKSEREQAGFYLLSIIVFLFRGLFLLFPGPIILFLVLF